MPHHRFSFSLIQGSRSPSDVAFDHPPSYNIVIAPQIATLLSTMLSRELYILEDIMAKLQDRGTKLASF